DDHGYHAYDFDSDNHSDDDDFYVSEPPPSQIIPAALKSVSSEPTITTINIAAIPLPTPESTQLTDGVQRHQISKALPTGKKPSQAAVQSRSSSRLMKMNQGLIGI